MAGGTWKAQNKRRPGVYINVKGNGKPVVNSPLGRLLMFQNKPLGWGKNGVITLDASSNFEELTGHKLSDPELAPVREALKGAETILLVNSVNGGTKAKFDGSKSENGQIDISIEAKNPGVVGNNITVDLNQADTNNNGITDYVITTILGTKILDQQTIKGVQFRVFLDSKLDVNKLGINSLNELEFENEYVKFKITDKAKEAFNKLINGAKELTPEERQNLDNASLFQLSGSNQLTGGTDGTNNVINVMNEVLENEYYSVATTAGWDESSNIHQLFAEQIKRLRENIGLKVRGVIPNSTDVAYNYEGISSVKNGYLLNDGTLIDVPTATARFAGMSASADAATALTYADIDDAVEASPRLNNEDTITALNNGEIVFSTRPGNRVVIEQDIDTLTSFSGEKPKEFSKNRIMRTLDEICSNTQQVFESSFLGKVGNDDAGRNLFKANRTAYLQGLQAQSIIQNFTPTDLEVLGGEDSDAVVMNLSVQPVDAMEKLYVTITVR